MCCYFYFLFHLLHGVAGRVWPRGRKSWKISYFFNLGWKSWKTSTIFR